MTETIVVTGATGNVGRVLVPLLAGTGVAVRAVSRDPAAAQFPAGVDAVKADLFDPATLDDAFAGADAVFLVWPSSDPAGADDAVAAIGRHARRVVFLSALGVPDPDPAGEPPTGCSTVAWSG